MQKKYFVPVLLSVLLAACSSTGNKNQGADQNAATDGTTVSTVTASEPGGNGMAALQDPNNILSQRSVYFDFDSYTVKPDFAALLSAHAQFLRDHPDMRMMVQGNTDERGSREYNLALGQKRAEALKKALIISGAAEANIEAVSMGEEKPRCSESNENCFAQNRRADMLYTGEF